MNTRKFTEYAKEGVVLSRNLRKVAGLTPFKLTFKDKNYWALILGGSSGIGLATAKKLARHGLNICIVHRDLRSRLEEVKVVFKEIEEEGVSVLTYNLDATAMETPERVIKSITEKSDQALVKVLIHAVSRGTVKSLLPKKPRTSKGGKQKDDLFSKFDEIDKAIESKHADIGVVTEKDIEITHQAMSTSLISWTRKLIENDMFAESGRVLALTSEGNKRIWHSYAVVALAKSSLETLVKYLAKELAPYDITANVIQAGITDTPSLRMIPGNEIITASTISRNPFGRLTKPEDIANFIYLLCQDEASWVNGAVIPVDGGEHIC